MPVRGLYTIADSHFNPCNTIPQLVEKLLIGGAPIVQLRMKTPPNLVLLAAREIIRFKDRFKFTFIVNDHVDVAIEVGADGVHVGSNDMPLAEVKAKIGQKMLVGYSSHSIEEAKSAAANGADYVAFGAIYPTRTKGPGHPVQGIDRLARVVEELEVPVVAIGGIDRSNIDRVVETGVAAVAMITALSQAPSVSDETRWFAQRLNKN